MAEPARLVHYVAPDDWRTRCGLYFSRGVTGDGQRWVHDVTLVNCTECLRYMTDDVERLLYTLKLSVR